MMLKTWSSSMLCSSSAARQLQSLRSHLDTPGINGDEDVVHLDQAVLGGCSSRHHLPSRQHRVAGKKDENKGNERRRRKIWRRGRGGGRDGGGDTWRM
mmetsp:Transcript_10207/g.34028  ORF Transcript_10207/g.34028 Transcript_10207/m.34028 type:complete len:98 (-) Transcript_10207:22-315(-)